MTDGVLLDPSRQRELRFRLHIPDRDGPWPLVIVSHGTGGSCESYSYLGQALAQAGFLAFHSNHPGSDKLILKTVRFSLNQEAILHASLNPKNWRDRPRDITFILDHWDEIESQVPSIRGRVSHQQLAIVGHSFGAYTALALAGAQVRMPGGPATFSDRRLKVFIAISPPGNSQIFDEHSWAMVRGPMLFVTGSKDEGLQGQPASWRVAAFEALPPGDKDLAFIEGATHLSFVDPLPFNDLPYVRELTVQAVRSYLQGYIGHQPKALQMLRSQKSFDSRLTWRQR